MEACGHQEEEAIVLLVPDDSAAEVRAAFQ
jgi:hypothetical protein